MKINKDAKSGEIVSEEYKDANPDTTYTLSIKRSTEKDVRDFLSYHLC